MLNGYLLGDDGFTSVIILFNLHNTLTSWVLVSPFCAPGNLLEVAFLLGYDSIISTCSTEPQVPLC